MVDYKWNILLYYYMFLYLLSKLFYVFEEYLVVIIFNCSDRGFFFIDRFG